MHDSSSTVVSFSGVTKVYRPSSILQRSSKSVLALDRVSFDVKRGSFFGLLGVNGSGKSTLMGILSGMVLKTAGKVMIGCYDIDNERRNASQILGVVPQEIVFDPFFTARETLRNHMVYFGFKSDNEKIEGLLHTLGLLDVADTLTRRLSGGMRRRLLVAKALITHPEVVILDEPTVGIDIEQKERFWQHIVHLNKHEGMTIILTTHHMEEVERFCDTIAMLSHGKIVKIGNTRDIVNQYRRTTYTLECSEFCSDMDLFLSVKRRLIDIGCKAEDISVTGRCMTLDGVKCSILSDAINMLGDKVVRIGTRDTSLESIFRLVTTPSR